MGRSARRENASAWRDRGTARLGCWARERGLGFFTDWRACVSEAPRFDEGEVTIYEVQLHRAVRYVAQMSFSCAPATAYEECSTPRSYCSDRRESGWDVCARRAARLRPDLPRLPWREHRECRVLSTPRDDHLRNCLPP